MAQLSHVGVVVDGEKLLLLTGQHVLRVIRYASRHVLRMKWRNSANVAG